jgi:hypothetical protein
MKPLMIDLCAGFGGQSEAFLQGGFDVIRVDNNPLLSEVPNMFIEDVYKIEPFNISGRGIDYIHAGPTCYEFSLAFNAPRSKAIHSGIGDSYSPTEGIRLVQRCKDIIDQLQPRYWSIENVRGSIKFLTPILGEPRLIIGPYVYWGNFPLFDIDVDDLPSKAQLDKRHSPLRANHRAECPLLLSQAFFDAMTKQKSILDF